MFVANRRFRRALLAGTALTLAVVIAPRTGHAASETFVGTVDGNFNNSANYSPTNTPGSGDTVTYNNTGSGQTAITFSQADTSISTLNFTQGTAYTFNLTAGQTLEATTALTSSSSAAQTFNVTGAGSEITINGLTNTGSGTLSFATSLDSNATLFNGAVSIGTSTLSFTGALPILSSSFTSGGGTLDLSASNGTALVGSIGGSGSLILGSNGLSTGSLGATTNYSGVISGVGPFLVTGGSLTLSGANTYTGFTKINNATLTAGIANTIANSNYLSLTNSSFQLNGFNQSINYLIGDSASTITLGANNLTVNGVGLSTTFAGTITGTGSVTYGGTGTLILSNSGNTYTGGTNANAGTLTLGTNNAIAQGPLAVASGATVGLGLYNQTVTTLNGAGAITSAGGALTAASGTYTGVYSGTGALNKTGSGTLTLAGANTYAGGTNISAGTLAAGANNVVGTGPVVVGSGATFAIGSFNQTIGALYGVGTVTSSGGAIIANSGGFSGTIASSSTLTKATSGGLILDGASSFTNTTVSGGTLEVGDAANANTTLGSPVTVTGGGTLAGHGTIFGNVTNMGGRVSPGGSIGTLTVNGNYTSTPNSTLAIELNPTSSSRLNVTGQAAINGGTLAITPDAGSYTSGLHYTILTAGGGVGGQFATITDSTSNVFFITSYLPNEIDLTTTGITGNIAGFTPNERRFSNALGAALTSNNSLAATGGSLYATILNNPSNVQVAGALGELRADSATIDLANVTSFQNFLTERMDQRQGLTSTKTANNGLPGTFDVAMNDSDMPLFGPGVETSLNQPSVWVHGYGVLGEAGSQTGYADYNYRTGGIVGGIDALVTPGTLLGAAAAYEHTDYNLGGDTDENNIDTYRFTLYGSQKLDPVPMVFDAAFGYAFNDYHNSDFLPLATGNGFSQTSRHDGNELTADAGLSHSFTVPQGFTSGKLTFIPRAGVEYDNIQQNRYSTTGAPVAGLNLQANGSTLNALRSTIGGRADLKLTTSNGTVVTPEVRASYLHDFMQTNVALTQAFGGAAGVGFQTSGIHPGREAALVGTGVTVGFSNRISATMFYDADVREHELDHTVQAGVKYKW